MRNPDTPSSKTEGFHRLRFRGQTHGHRPPLGVLDASELNFTDGGLQVNFGEDGIHSGFFTGAAAKDEIFEILYSSNGIDDDIRTLVEGLLIRPRSRQRWRRHLR